MVSALSYITGGPLRSGHRQPRNWILVFRSPSALALAWLRGSLVSGRGATQLGELRLERLLVVQRMTEAGRYAVGFSYPYYDDEPKPRGPLCASAILEFHRTICALVGFLFIEGG